MTQAKVAIPTECLGPSPKRGKIQVDSCVMTGPPKVKELSNAAETANNATIWSIHVRQQNIYIPRRGRPEARSVDPAPPRQCGCGHHPGRGSVSAAAARRKARNI